MSAVSKMRLPTAVKKEVQRVLRDGWTLEMGGHHYKLRRPEVLGGGRVIMSTSASCDVSKAVIHDIRKLEATKC